MKLKLSISMLAVFFIWGMSLLYAFDPVDGDHDEDEGGGGSGTTCTVTSNCFNVWGNLIVGSVSCTGKKCERGHEWVKCDDNRTDC